MLGDNAPQVPNCYSGAEFPAACQVEMYMSARLLVAFAVLSISLSGCTPSQPEVVRPTGQQSYPPTRFVEMLESAPSRAYIQIGVIDSPGEPGALRAQVLAQIQAKAQQLGADAVILQDLSRPAPVTQRLNPTTGLYESSGGQLIPAFKGIAIKYR
jgi:hypothetical protein